MTAKAIATVPVNGLYGRVEQVFKFNVEGSLALSSHFGTRVVCAHSQHVHGAYAS